MRGTARSFGLDRLDEWFGGANALQPRHDGGQQHRRRGVCRWHGVCQDHTHAFLACVRSLGIPARYVSGYLCTEDESHLASHAWAEAWLDDGWYSFDVTNQLTFPDRHLKLAVGLTTSTPARYAACAAVAERSRCRQGCR